MNTSEIMSAMIFGDGGASKVEELSTDGGSTDAGKVLVVGDNGKIAASDLTVGEGEIALDKTLSVNGAAADAKKTGDAIASLNGSLGTLGTLINVVPTDTASGAVASFSDGANDIPVKNLTVNIESVQSGTGNPSPDNVRPISGWTGATLTCNNETINIDWADEAGEVFGGTLNVTTGELTVKRVGAVLDELEMTRKYTGNVNKTLVCYMPYRFSRFIDVSKIISEQYSVIDTISGASNLSQPDNKSVGLYPYNNTGSPTTTSVYIVIGVNDSPTGRIVYTLANPQTYQLTPQEVKTILGENNIFADTGDVSVEYRADIKKYIDKVVATAVSALS